jgi:tetratricopeptide (TPR) repeat protein
MARIITRVSANILFVLLSLAASIAVAGDDAAWDEGLAAFAHGEYSTALAEFEAALAAGQSGPAVHYNIGVCQFELGQYSDAAATFAHISTQYPKMRALAEYNRGLVAVEQDKAGLARQYFLTSYDLSADNEKLRILSSTMLRRIEPTASNPSPWVAAVGINAGYDDNIVLRDEIGIPLDVSTESSLVDVLASVRGPIAGLTGLHFDGNAYLISYFDNDDFNQSAINAGISYDWGLDNWTARIGLNAGYSTFGGDAFDNSRNLDARLERTLSATSSFRLRYRYADIDASNPIYTGIDGSRQSLEIAYRWSQDSGRFDVSYVVESNDRIDPGVSAARNRLRLRYRYTFGPVWTADIGGDFRVSKYDDLVPDRTEDLVTLNIGLSRSLRSDWLFMTRLQHSKNTSTDAVFSYTRNQISVGLLKLF